jgi:DNA-binding MarR family transcriptional regulator
MSENNLIYEKLMDILDDVLTKVESLHAPSRDFGTGVPIHRKEIHTLQAIGRYPKMNITALAEHMGVTKGAISQTVAKLVSKKLVQKTYAKGNKKEVLLELTDLGWIGFQNHAKFHTDMLNIARDYYGKELKTKMEMFRTVMTDFRAVLDEHERRKKSI